MLTRWHWAVLVVVGVPAVSLTLVLLASPDLAFYWHNTPLLLLSKCAAVIGASLFAMNFLLSSRSPLVEKWFGGLDNVYRLHRWTGYTAWGFLTAHAGLMVWYVWPFPTLLQQILIPGRYWPYNWGVLALSLMDVLIFATLIKQIPYHWWRNTHTFMSVALLMALFHVTTVPSDVRVFMPLRVWLLGLFTVSVVSYFYRKVWFPYFGPQYHYIVKKITNKQNIFDLLLTPLGKPLPFHPGQFVFMDVPRHSVISDEDHPFSLASDPTDGTIRLGIKQVGDYTRRLEQLKPGNEVVLRGPYGHFAEKLQVMHHKDAIWIAGGVGITPFLSMLSWEAKQPHTRKIWFFHTSNSPADAVFEQDVQRFQKKAVPRIIYSPWYSQKQGRITAQKVQEQVGTLQKKLIFLCGPTLMMYDLANQFRALGVRNSNIIFEDFSFK